MKFESVDFFYLSMPEVLDIGDGSQDALLVRVESGCLPVSNIVRLTRPVALERKSPNLLCR